MFEYDDDEEAPDQRQILCERCRKFAPFHEVKYVPKGNDTKMALCKNCLKNFNASPSQIKKVAAVSSMQSYVCGRCNYKFKFNAAGHSQLRCPYCGKEDKIIESKVTSAGALLKDTDF